MKQTRIGLAASCRRCAVDWRSLAGACSVGAGRVRAARGTAQVHDRVLEPGRRRQRLARGDALLGQGPGRQGRQRHEGHDHPSRHRRPGQLADIRTLIAQGVNAIIINPAGPDALNPAIAEAIAAGITVVAVDASVTAPGAYNLSNDQEQYAYLGASWLFKAAWAARAPSSTCAASPAIRPTPTATRASRRPSRSTRASRSPATTVTKWDPATATQPDQRHHERRHEVRRHLDVRRRLEHRRRAQGRQPPVRADRRRGQRRLRHPAPQRDPASRAPRSPTRRPSVAPASPSPSRSSPARSPQRRPST